MKTFRNGLLAAFLAVVVLGCKRGPSVEDLTPVIRSVVEADSSNAVRTFYAERNYEPAFVHPAQSEERLESALELFCQSAAHGLNPDDYLTESLRRHLERAYGERSESDADEARRLGELDIAVSRILMQYAADVQTGRVDPKAVSSTWKTPVHQIEPARVVSRALADDSIESIPERIGATHGEYAQLQQALARYRSIERNGGWGTISDGEPLEEGASGVRVKQLIERLAAEGDVDSAMLTDSSYRFTQEVVDAVRSVQRRFGLEVDGVAGEGVIAALNVPIEDRIEQIAINMERWRWIPGHFGSRYLYVNIPAFELHAFDEGREVLSMAVVVGEVYEDNATPVFSDTMEYVVFNPYWNVPQSIAETEIVPPARQDRSYLVRNDYEIVSSWSDEADVLNPMTANLDRVVDGTYRVRQKPGSQNALGRIKFMFPNDFNIYLHDTPADYLFERAERAYSHGCIRVEKPEELAEYVFRDDEWTAERIQEEIESRSNETVSLAEPLPVYILYWTAFVDGGRINFREDLYGNDADLRDALKRRAASRGVPCETLRALIKS